LNELKGYTLEELMTLHAAIDYENKCMEVAEKNARDKQ